MFQCQLPERGHFSLHTHCGLWDRNLCQCHAGYISQEPWTEWAKQTQTWLIPLVFHSIFRTQLVKNPDPEAVFRHYQIRKWISSQFRKKCSDALDEPSAEEAKWIRPNNETRQRTTALNLLRQNIFFKITRQFMSWYSNLPLTFTGSAHYSFLALVKTKTPHSQRILIQTNVCLSSALSTLHTTTSWQLLHWINHEYWLTCIQPSA